MLPKIDRTQSCEQIIEVLAAYLKDHGFTIAEIDKERPWGGFIRIADDDAQKFIASYFEGVSLPPVTPGAPLSPKFLIVDANKMLSWQVHQRRGEFWRVLLGPVGAYLSDTDAMPEAVTTYQHLETITIPVGTRHRLVGLDERGVVAEIWIHTDKDHPSDEADIRRIADDFGR